MNLDKLFYLTESLQKQAIGEPVWIESKTVFEYPNRSVEVVATLKIIRAAQGVKSLYILCSNGLFIDMGAIYRCVTDCIAEVYFMLEKYPKTSDNVDKFVRSFFENTIDGYLSVETEPVLMKRIHNAMVRVLTGLEQDEGTHTKIRNVYKAFSGYTHANYSHIMQIYGGTPADLSFNLAGVPAVQQREMQMQIVEQGYLSVLHSLAFIAASFGLKDLHKDILKCY
jgi:hypothetical protein